MANLDRLGFICDPATPLAGMIACAGSSRCASGLADAKADALVLAPMLPRGTRTVHVSGCTKSCASPAAADRTLVALGSGLYDLYAKCTEAGAGRFGRRVASQLTLDEAGRLLRDSP
jgi:precorrin-3B synthase